MEPRLVTDFERPPSRLGPSALAMASSVARMFHIEGKSKVEIADQLGVSRYKVARVLKSALDSGIVKIQIELPSHIDSDLSYALQTRFGLRQSIVVATPDDDADANLRALAEIGAEFLMETATPEDVIGFAWSRTLGALSHRVSSLPACTVVQATGAMTHGNLEDNSIEVVRRLSMVSGGKAWAFYAPLLAPDAAAADALRRSEIRGALDLLGNLTRVFLSVGYWAPGESALYDALRPRERDALTEAGVCADVAGITFAADGSVVPGLADRRIGITLDQIRATPDVVLLVGGVNRAPALRAVLQTGLATTVITHQSLARKVLEADQQPLPTAVVTAPR